MAIFNCYVKLPEGTKVETEMKNQEGAWLKNNGMHKNGKHL